MIDTPLTNLSTLLKDPATQAVLRGEAVRLEDLRSVLRKAQSVRTATDPQPEPEASGTVSADNDG